MTRGCYALNCSTLVKLRRRFLAKELHGEAGEELFQEAALEHRPVPLETHGAAVLRLLDEEHGDQTSHVRFDSVRSVASDWVSSLLPIDEGGESCTYAWYGYRRLDPAMADRIFTPCRCHSFTRRSRRPPAMRMPSNASLA